MFMNGYETGQKLSHNWQNFDFIIWRVFSLAVNTNIEIQHYGILPCNSENINCFMYRKIHTIKDFRLNVESHILIWLSKFINKMQHTHHQDILDNVSIFSGKVSTC